MRGTAILTPPRAGGVSPTEYIKSIYGASIVVELICPTPLIRLRYSLVYIRLILSCFTGTDGLTPCLAFVMYYSIQFTDGTWPPSPAPT